PMAWRAAAALQLLFGQLSLFPLGFSGAGAQGGPDFELQQPQDKVSVAAGETLTLTCTTSGTGPAGPVKWLKGWGNGNETVYDQTGTFPRVTRVVSHSNTDFSIHIREFHPKDAGTYYCVKFNKMVSGVEVFRRGKGTVVSLHGECSPAGSPILMVAAAVVRKRRGEAESQCLARLAAVGSFLPIPGCWSPGTPSHGPHPTAPILPAQSSKEDIHYADLQPLPAAPRHSRTPGAACSEYASIRVAAK
uniref:Ig-like domain-containing protein n=1 Tax=Buteo japonicus TaxID=224669 RepID=A0A8C0AR53_9AVES